MTKKHTINDVAISIAVIEERVKVLPDIEKHLKGLNDSVAETNVKLAKTDAIATAADTKATTNSKRYDRLIITLIVSSLAIAGAVIANPW